MKRFVVSKFALHNSEQNIKITHRQKMLWLTFWTCLRFLQCGRQIIMQQETVQHHDSYKDKQMGKWYWINFVFQKKMFYFVMNCWNWKLKLKMLLNWTMKMVNVVDGSALSQKKYSGRYCDLSSGTKNWDLQNFCDTLLSGLCWKS